MSEQTDYKDPKAIIEAEIGITHIDLTMEPVPIGEILNELMPQGLEAKIEEIVDQTIVIHSIRLFVGSYGPAAFVVFTDDNGELFNFIVGQKIVLPKLLAAMDRLPVSATIRRHEGGQFGYYYDIE